MLQMSDPLKGPERLSVTKSDAMSHNFAFLTVLDKMEG